MKKLAIVGAAAFLSICSAAWAETFYGRVTSVKASSTSGGGTGEATESVSTTPVEVAPAPPTGTPVPAGRLGEEPGERAAASGTAEQQQNGVIFPDENTGGAGGAEAAVTHAGDPSPE